MKLTVKKGTTSKILHLFILDSSKSDGSGLTGLAYNSSGLTAYYIREGDALSTFIYLADATVGTYTSSGFKEVDATNMPGVYELHSPNACLASGADSVVIFLKGATNMAPLPIEIQLDDNTSKDIYDRIGSPAGANIAADLVTIDGVVDTILDDTNELQTNQGDWLTATGFSVPNEYDAVIAALQTDLDNPDQYKADVSALATAANVAAVPSDVWDRILTGATHNIPTSAGRRLREIGAFAIHSGTAQAGNSHSITLAATASPSDAAYHGIYNRNLLVLTDNTGVGQTRTIVDYDAITKITVIDRDWRISPDNTTAYQIVPDDTPLTVDHGVAQGGTARTITIRDYASSDDDAYLCNIVTIIAGTGRGQARLVDAYDGTTKVVTICGDDWVAIPDTTSIYVMMPYGVACAACMGDEALAQIKAELDAATSGDLKKHDNKITGLII
jgi:hypothetical protein